MGAFPKGFSTFAEYNRFKQHVTWGDQYALYTAFDSFTRADSSSTPGAATEKGGSWAVVAGTFGITSNKLYCNGATGKATLGTLGSTANGTVQLTLTSSDWVNQPIQTMVRYTDASNFLGFMITSTTAASIRTMIAGSLTSFAGLTPTTLVAGTPSTFKIILSGTSVTVYQDGVALVPTVTLTGGAAALLGTGCGVWMNGSGNTTATNVDNYSVTPA